VFMLTGSSFSSLFFFVLCSSLFFVLCSLLLPSSFFLLPSFFFLLLLPLPGLRTLEFWIDNLNMNYLYPIIESAQVLNELMVSLKGLLQPNPIQHGEVAVRILGKLGGRNRQVTIVVVVGMSSLECRRWNVVVGMSLECRGIHLMYPHCSLLSFSSPFFTLLHPSSPFFTLLHPSSPFFTSII
jgi:hypothetical protein